MPNNDIWNEYKKTNSKQLRDQLIIENIELVKIIAGRLYHSYSSYVDYDDLVSYGILGLIDAIDKFEPEKKIKFETYANFRIRGAIIDQLRSLDWVPRSTRQKYKKLEQAIQKLQGKYGLDIKDELIAKELGMSLEEFSEFLSNVSILSVISLDEKISENTNFSISSNDNDTSPEESYLKSETKKILMDTISKLPEREQTIIKLYYFSELTYKEIANILNISESRVSQIHTKCMLKLKNILEKFYKVGG